MEHKHDEIVMDRLSDRSPIVFVADGDGVKIQLTGVNGTLLEIPAAFVTVLARPTERKDRPATLVDQSPYSGIHQ